MSEISIQLHWQRVEPELKPGAYSGKHTVQFNNSYDLPVDAAPDYGGDPTITNPEQAFTCEGVVRLNRLELGLGNP
jgi:hypothetical protein